MKRQNVTVIDYGMGNVCSVINALEYLGSTVTLTNDSDQIRSADYLILPGVGSFRKAMQALNNGGTDKAICHAVQENSSHILGICLGMQLLGSHSTEDGDTIGLGIVQNRVEQFSQQELRDNKLPHVGYNSIHFSEAKGLFYEIPHEAVFYFNHSYRMLVDGFTGRYATCTYGIEFLAAFEIDNIYGTQFHPEKSQSNGLLLLKNFMES
jgi:glutamine amidotransferase